MGFQSISGSPITMAARDLSVAEDASSTSSFDIGPGRLDGGPRLEATAVRANIRHGTAPNAISPLVLVQADVRTRWEAIDETLVGFVRLVHIARTRATVLPALLEDRASLGRRRLSNLGPGSEFRLGVSGFVEGDLVETVGNLAGLGGLGRGCYRVDASKEHHEEERSLHYGRLYRK